MVKLTDNQKKLAAARQAAFYNRNNEMILLRIKNHRLAMSIMQNNNSKLMTARLLLSNTKILEKRT